MMKDGTGKGNKGRSKSGVARARIRAALYNYLGAVPNDSLAESTPPSLGEGEQAEEYSEFLTTIGNKAKDPEPLPTLFGQDAD